MQGFIKNHELLDEAQGHWLATSDFRMRRERCKRYCYGDQWSDPVMVDGKWMKEDQYIRSMGSEPLKNNLIRRLVKQVLGLFRTQMEESGDALEPSRQSGLAEAYRQMRLLNDMNEMDARALEELLISGLTIQRKTFGVRHGVRGCFTDNVSPGRFIIDSSFRDTRGWDVRFVGEIHDLGFDALCAEFAQSEADFACLAEIYNPSTYDERLSVALPVWCRPTRWHRVPQSGCSLGLQGV